jgi:hypothetical protein
VSLGQHQRRQTRQARVEAEARRAEANRQLELADRVDPDTG